ncbi:MAG: hypothetical protein IJA31_12560 [Clostridia bacterium]|nr:hypothetical protein [Clostridia bacterium]
MDKTTIQSRNNGTLPDKFWYQINNATAQTNWIEQRKKISEDILDVDEEDSIHIIVKEQKK